jgi:hypothetical protein
MNDDCYALFKKKMIPLGGRECSFEFGAKPECCHCGLDTRAGSGNIRREAGPVSEKTCHNALSFRRILEQSKSKTQ